MYWSDIPRRPPRSTLRWFAIFSTIALTGLAVWQFFSDSPVLAGILLGAALVALSLGTMYPGLLRPIFVGWLMLLFPLNWLISHIILAVIFYGVFTPLGLWFRLIGRDVLKCRSHAEAESYWTVKAQAEDVRSYLRQ